MRYGAIPSNFGGSKSPQIGGRGPLKRIEAAIRLSPHIQEADARISLNCNFVPMAVEFRVFSMDHCAQESHHRAAVEMRDNTLLANLRCREPLKIGGLAERRNRREQKSPTPNFIGLPCPRYLSLDYSRLLRSADSVKPGRTLAMAHVGTLSQNLSFLRGG
jgi:hypothetical protein